MAIRTTALYSQTLQPRKIPMSQSATPVDVGNPVRFYGILIAISTIGPLAMNIFVPSIPGLMREFSVSSGTVQLTLTIYLAGLAVSQLVYGPLSDRLGRRPVLLGGLVLYVFSSAVCASANSIEALTAARFVQALGGASGMVLSRAIVRDLHGREAAASVLGYVTMAWVLVPMFAPALGGLLDEVASWRMSFYVLSGFGSVVLLLTAWGLPETNPPTGRDPGEPIRLLSGMGALLREPVFIAYTLTLGFCSAVFFSFLAGAPFLMVEVMGYSPLDYGLWFMLISVGYMTGNFLSGRYSQRVGIDRMIGIGNGLALVGTLTMLLFGTLGTLTPITLFGPMLFVTLGNGLTIPNGMAAAISVLPRTVGAAAGLSGFSQIGIGAAASQLTGAAQGTFSIATLWVMFAGAILAGVVHHVMLRRSRTRSNVA